MRRNFFLSSIKLISLGVALGFLARYMLGDPIPAKDQGLQFNSPIDRTSLEQVEEEVSDFPLLED